MQMVGRIERERVGREGVLQDGEKEGRRRRRKRQEEEYYGEQREGGRKGGSGNYFQDLVIKLTVCNNVT